MKTAMKRLLSFVLVAMMLVSIVPFQASAKEAGTFTANINVCKFGEWSVALATGSIPNVSKVSPNEVYKAVTIPDGYKVSYVVWADGTEDNDVSVTGDAYTLSDTKNTFTVVVVEDKDWTISVKVGSDNLGSDEFTVTGTEPNEQEISSAISGLVNGKYDNLDEDDFYVKEVTSNKDAKTVSVVYTPRNMKVTVSVTAGETKTKDFYVPYGSKFNLNNSLIADVFSNYNSNLYTTTGATWSVSNGTISEGGFVVEANNATASVTLPGTGYRRVELLNANGTHYGYAYLNGNYVVDCPVPDNYRDQKFLEWIPYNATGTSLAEGKDMTGFHVYDQYIAKWTTDVNNGKSTLKVVAVYYADDHEKDRKEVFTRELNNTDTNILSGVLGVANDQIEAAIEGNAPAHFGEVTWDGNYYNSSFSTKYTDTSLTMNGNKTIYVKINANDSAKAKVLLYVYKKVKETPDQILEMKGYLPHDDITLNEAITVAKKADWRASSYKMYNDREWKQLLNVTNATVYTTEEIEAGEGTTVVHLLLSNGYKTGGNADTSNPKTGDTILMAGGVLGLSAAALAVLYFLNKKKQVI